MAAASVISRASVAVTTGTGSTLSSPTTASICSGSPFSYNATVSGGGSTFSWTRAAVAGISNAAGSGGNGTINETLVNTTNNPVNVTYAIAINNGSCVATQNLIVTVNPGPGAVTATATPNTICGVGSVGLQANSSAGGSTVVYNIPLAQLINCPQNCGDGASIRPVRQDINPVLPGLMPAH